MPNLFLQLSDDDDGAGVSPAPLTEIDALAFLQRAEISASKLIPWGSNYSFAVALDGTDGCSRLAIYKPRDGEAPLYDFPDGTLYLRETAAYVFSRWLGWDLVPPTVIRDGPHGVGSVQLYVEPGPDSDNQRYWGSTRPEIERVVLFDHLTNNADRKIGHLLRDRAGKVWGIDHGLTFNCFPKLRTVLWQFVGLPVSPELLTDLRRLRRGWDEARRELAPLLASDELQALLTRVDHFLAQGAYPNLNPRRNVPYGWW